MTVTEQTMIRLSSIDPSPHHHRTWWGDMPALQGSIKIAGIIQPLVVRPVGRRYEMICGERRRRCAEKLELKEVPCRILDVTDVEAIDIQARENLDREDLHPIDKAQYFEDLIGHGFDMAEVAKRFRVKPRDVIRALKLLSLSTQSRAAYAKGELGEGTIGDAAAFALARIVDASQQRDILAAIKSGALQPEQVPGHVRQHFMLPLADAPWGLGDAGLVEEAGSCSACPKRSAAQRDLFDDTAADHCLDVDCYRGKMSATWERAVAGAERNRIEILDRSADEIFVSAIGRSNVIKSSGYVDADATCPHLAGHTWGEAILKAAPEEMPAQSLIRDDAGRPRLLYRESAATRIVRKSDAVAKITEAARKADPVREGIDTRAEGRIRREVVERIAVAVAAADDSESWGWVVQQVMGLATSRSVAATAAQYELADAAALHEMLAGAANRKRKSVALSILVRDAADIAGPLPASIAEICGICGLDVVVIEAQVRSPK